MVGPEGVEPSPQRLKDACAAITLRPRMFLTVAVGAENITLRYLGEDAFSRPEPPSSTDVPVLTGGVPVVEVKTRGMVFAALEAGQLAFEVVEPFLFLLPISLVGG